MQSWTKWLVVSAISVGGVFELAKRLNWLPSIEPVKQETVNALPDSPYSRALPPVARAHRDTRNRLKTAATKTAGVSSLVIPPTKDGQFDTHAGSKKPEKRYLKKKEKPKEEEKADKRCIGKETMMVWTPDSDEENTIETIEQAQTDSTPKTGKEALREVDELPFCEEEKKVAQDEAPAEKPEIKEDSGDDYNGIYGGGAGAAPDDSEEALAGLEEWKALLLEAPNFKETVRLIELFQMGKIRHELFYTLVELMLESPRREIRELGILAAGRTPSFDSYHVLIGVIKRESFGSPFRIKAEAELNFYIQLNFLSVLENVLRNSNDVFAVVYATKKLDESAKRYLSANYRRASQDAAHPYAKYFQRFVALLTTISKSPDSQQANQARQTLLSLQDLLKV